MVDQAWQERIRALNRRIDDLNLRIAEESVELQYLNARNQRLQAENSILSQQRATTTERNAEVLASLPMIRRIEGFGGRRQATLILESAAVVVQPGDTVTGGWKVKSIEPQAVVLEGNGTSVRLRFGTTPPPPPAARQTAGSAPPPVVNGIPMTTQRPSLPPTIPLGLGR